MVGGFSTVCDLCIRTTTRYIYSAMLAIHLNSVYFRRIVSMAKSLLTILSLGKCFTPTSSYDPTASATGL